MPEIGKIYRLIKAPKFVIERGPFGNVIITNNDGVLVIDIKKTDEWLYVFMFISKTTVELAFSGNDFNLYFEEVKTDEI